MKFKVFLLLAVLLTSGRTAVADTLHLKNGQVIYGTFNGRVPQGIQFTGMDGRMLTIR